MDLFDVVVAKKLSGGGGGGSNDFSTAEVTVVNNSVNEVELPIIYVGSTPMGDVLLSSVAYIDAQDTQTINAVLYNNNAFVDVYGLNVSVSGNASIGNDAVIITGDCTITIS